VTPLVDVVLVLLIIFMVVTPSMQSSVDVDLPKLQDMDQKNNMQEKPLILGVTKKGDYFFEKKRMPLLEVVQEVKQQHTLHPSKDIVLKADKGVPYGDIRTFLKHMQSAGISSVSLEVAEATSSQGT
jgi:biopolymer transport protein TolR